MDVPLSIEKDKKKTKKYAWIATTTYLVLFPFLFMLAVASIMIFDGPRVTVPIGLTIVFVYFCMPFSIPLTFYFVWSRYLRGDYKKSRQFCLLPMYVAAVTVFCFALLDIITNC